jgi:glutathionyl-hydroquinone reductase
MCKFAQLYACHELFLNCVYSGPIYCNLRIIENYFDIWDYIDDIKEWENAKQK